MSNDIADGRMQRIAMLAGRHRGPWLDSRRELQMCLHMLIRLPEEDAC